MPKPKSQRKRRSEPACSTEDLEQERLLREKKERKEERARIREQQMLIRERRRKSKAALEKREVSQEESESKEENSDEEYVIPAVLPESVPDSKYTLEITFLNAAPFKNLIAKLSTIFSSCPVEFVPGSPLDPEDSDDEEKEAAGSYLEEPEDLESDSERTNSVIANDRKFAVTGGIRIFNITEDRKVVVRATINADMLNKFYCEKITKIGVNIMVLNRALKIIKDSDMLSLRMRRGSDDFLYISGKEVGKSNDRMAELRMFLPSADGHPVDLCKKSYDYEITMEAGELQRVCKNMTTGSPDLQIWANNDSISFKSQNESIITTSKHGDFDEDICDEEHQYDEDSMQGIASEIGASGRKTECLGSFNLKHMLIFASTAKSDVNVVRLHLAHREPLMIWTSISNIGDLYAMIVPALRTNFRQQ